MIHLHENFLDDNRCTKIAYLAHSLPRVPSKVGGGAVESKVVETMRKSSTIETSVEPFLHNLLLELNEAIKEKIEAVYSCDATGFYPPKLIEHKEGEYYRYHNDAQVLEQRDGMSCWVKTLNRDISAVLYINDEFEGGNLHFPLKETIITPKKGMLVTFPSGHEYRHCVLPVTQGVRLSIVNWYETDPRFVPDVVYL
jgi:predicted 2-oxoglutarate/Fe(II)-dependent dioxygenase YbiX